MARVVPALAGAMLLASVTFAVGAAEPAVCVADDQTPCGLVLQGEIPVTTPDQDVSVAPDISVAPVEAAPADQPTTTTTRTIGPAVVVQPFAGVAAPAAPQTEDVTAPRIKPAEPQKLPPGPPSRLP